MASNHKLVSDVEALLEVAKSYDVEKAERTRRLDLIARLDALREELEDPVEKMFSQITNVCLSLIERTCRISMLTYLDGIVLSNCSCEYAVAAQGF